jgi:hypothetical protein
MKEQDDGENCIMKRFIICTSQNISEIKSRWMKWDGAKEMRNA